MTTNEIPKPKTITITRKIRLNIDVPGEDKENLKKYYQRLYEWQWISYKACNIIATHLYCQEQLKQFTYLNNKAIKLFDKDKKDNSILNTARLNCTYRLLSEKYQNQLPGTIITCLNMVVYKNFINEKKDYFSGKRSLRNYKENMPVPFRAKSIFDLRYNDKTKNFHFTLFKKSDLIVPLRTYLGRDMSNNKVILERIISGEYKICDSSYRIENNKIYLLLSLKFLETLPSVNQSIKAEANLSFLAPVVIKFKNKEYKIGNSDTYVHKRQAIQQGLKRTQAAMKYNNGGKGRKQKTAGIDLYKEKEKNFINTFSHTITKEIINFCLKYSIGTLELSNSHKLIEEAKDNPIILRDWSFGNILKKLEYKCSLNNIILIV